MISFVLHAKNSSGDAYLSIDKQADGTYGITLLGTLDGNDIQIDFDSLSEYEIEDLANFIGYKRKRPSQFSSEKPQGGEDE